MDNDYIFPGWAAIEKQKRDLYELIKKYNFECGDPILTIGGVTQVVNALYRHEVYSREQLFAMDINEFKMVRGLGRKGMDLIRRIKTRGLLNGERGHGRYYVQSKIKADGILNIGDFDSLWMLCVRLAHEDGDNDEVVQNLFFDIYKVICNRHKKGDA